MRRLLEAEARAQRRLDEAERVAQEEVQRAAREAEALRNERLDRADAEAEALRRAAAPEASSDGAGEGAAGTRDARTPAELEPDPGRAAAVRAVVAWVTAADDDGADASP